MKAFIQTFQELVPRDPSSLNAVTTRTFTENKEQSDQDQGVQATITMTRTDAKEPSDQDHPSASYSALPRPLLVTGDSAVTTESAGQVQPMAGTGTFTRVREQADQDPDSRGLGTMTKTGSQEQGDQDASSAHFSALPRP